MEFQKIVWKINFQKGHLDTQSLFRFFNTLIENSPQVFVDIADYKHVPEGPVILLVGVNADVGYDSHGGELGLSYNQKQIIEGTNQQKLKSTFSSLISIYSKMHEYSGFSTPPVVDLSKITFILNDRALAPNSEKIFESVSGDIKSFFTELLGEDSFQVKHAGSEKERLTVEIFCKNVA